MLRTIFYTIWRVLCYYTVILKHTDLNITEFLPKILLFPEDCTCLGLSQVPSDKKSKFIKYENILLGVHFNLRYSKLKSDYSKVIKSAYVMGVVHNHFLSLCKRDNTTKKL